MKKTLENIFNVCFLIIAVMIFEAAFSQRILQSWLGGLLIIPATLLFLYICIKKADFIDKINYKKAWWILRIISFVLMMTTAFILEVDYTWDWGRLIISSYNYITTQTLDQPDYFARYPNNQFWLICMIGLFKLIKIFVGNADMAVFKYITIALSVILLQIAIEFIYRTARMIFSEKKAFFAGVITVFCLPIYLYSEFFYTDTPSILLISIMLFLYFKLQQTKSTKAQILISVLFGIIGALTYFVKITAFIVFVAMLIGIIFTKISLKQFLCFFLISVVMLGATYKAINIAINPIITKQYGITDELSDKNKFPSAHWVMMGLGYGGYLQEDVDYTMSFDTYDKKQDADVKEIKKRISDYGFSGFIKHTFSDKVVRTWGDSMLGGDNYVSRSPMHENNIVTRIFSSNGDLHDISLVFSWIYYIIMLLGILFSAIEALKKSRSKSNAKLLAARIAVFGIFMFMLVWECNSRYLLVFTPMFILLCADGLSHFVTFCKRFTQKS